MTSAINHALEAAIRRAYELGRIDQSIEWAAEELRRVVMAEPDITPLQVVRRYNARPGPWSNVPDWDEALWRIADVWCELHRGLQGRPARRLPASPYSVLVYAIPAREAAATQR
jgi:hypothetical protein